MYHIILIQQNDNPPSCMELVEGRTEVARELASSGWNQGGCKHFHIHKTLIGTVNSTYTCTCTCRSFIIYSICITTLVSNTWTIFNSNAQYIESYGSNSHIGFVPYHEYHFFKRVPRITHEPRNG